MKKTFILICLSALLFPAALFAKDGPPPFHRGPNEAVKKYIKEQVMPVLLQKRAQFDRELSEDEKSEISVCRAALKQLRSQHHDFRGPGNGDNPPPPPNAQGNAKDAPHNEGQHPDFAQHKEIMERLQAIADKHSNSLQDIKTQLEPTRKQWLADMKKLQPAPTEQDTKSAYQPGGDKPVQDKPAGNRPPMGHGPGGFPFAHHMEAVRFLLLSANSDEQPAEEIQADLNEPAGVATVSANKLTVFTIMPNPATNDVQLGADILPANNQLKIVNIQGKEVLAFENVQALQHLNVGQLAGGTYLIQITSGEQLLTKKLIINR